MNLFQSLIQAAGRGNLTLADLAAGKGGLPRDAVRMAASRYNDPAESWVAPAGVNVPSDVNVYVSPNEMSRGEGFQTGRNVLFGGRVYPGQLAHELQHVEQDRRWGPLAQPLYQLMASYLQARGVNPYTQHPFEQEGEQARADYERKADVARGYQAYRRGERGG